MPFRSRRLEVSGFGAEGRLLALSVGMLIILGMLIARARNPDSWSWLAAMPHSATVVREQRPATPPVQRVLRSRPAEAPRERVERVTRDQDPGESAEAAAFFEKVTDKKPLVPPEMPAYWRLMSWSRDAAFADLEARSQRNALFTQLWEQPEKYRGKLVRLRLHVVRGLEFQAPENPAGVQKVYELWGATDESKSYPFVVVTSELPKGVKLGANMDAEVVFVGYFLKIMAYRAFDVSRGAPLLVGRLQRVAAPGVTAPSPPPPAGRDWLTYIGLGCVVGYGLWRLTARRPRTIPVSRAASDDESAVRELFLQPLEAPQEMMATIPTTP